MKLGDALIALATRLGYSVAFVDVVKRRGGKPVPEGYESVGYCDYERRPPR